MAVPSSSLLSSLLLLALFLHHHCSAAHDRGSAAVVVNISAVEDVVRDRAFELLHRTDKLVGVPLTACPSACGLVEVQASALRVRSSSLWADGVNATDAAAGTAGFTVPPRVVPSPFARRVDVVFERFVGSNSSGALFAVPPGYALAAPVAALLAYDVSTGNNGSRAVGLRALGAPVRVEFGDLSSAAANGTQPFNATAARCVTFAVASGQAKAVATHAMASDTACTVTGTGHYGVAVRLQPPPPSPTPPTPQPPAAVRERWWAWMAVAGVGGVVAVGFLAATVVAAVRWSRRRRREEMDLRALAGEELGRMAVRGSRMPAAKMVRTRPELEDGSPMAWRR
ncbi:hypothetical protein CFC21_107515 [Triticum aestivum]|uniref:Legume lectin domain-containing protein n=2 Tax=Triticum aestivum TaxID=4565 RepID=A0A3B6TDY1_WHEAT|nr:uncharacterized protein LOC123169948 [Triticum aestivum]KAF7106805.1 hypothetical protein CFC21_107515 [Triticum aestivum]